MPTTSAQVQTSNEPKRKRFYNVREDLAEIVAERGFNPETAGEDFNTLIDACIKAFTYKPRKLGVIITGKYGCGKTHFVKSLGLPFKFFDMNLPEVIEQLDWKGGYAPYINEIMDGNVFIDDLGAEQLFNEYGTKRDIIAEFICRYHVVGKGRLFITSNLNGNQLLDRYGGRVIDRLKELCVPAKMVGESKRKWL